MVFLIEHYKKILFMVFASCMMFSMLFYGVTNSDIGRKPVEKKVCYSLGKDKKFIVSKRQIEAMKTFLSHDMGYGFNDALSKQNIFGDGFFVEILCSSFGRKLLQNNFDLVKDDFEKVTKKHQHDTMYRHRSGKFSLEDQLKIYAPTLYEKYQSVKDFKREKNFALLNDYIDLIYEHTLFRPKDMKMLTRIICRDRKLGYDSSIDKRNIALFHAKNYEDILGKSSIELLSQGILYLAHIAEENGYKTTLEEAQGVIYRRAYELIGEVYTKVQEREEKDKIFKSFASSLGIGKKDLVEAAKKIITIQKMYMDISGSLILDDVTLKSLFKDVVEKAEVVMVRDNVSLNVDGAEKALLLDSYLTAIGKSSEFLKVPEKAYEEKNIAKNFKDLFVEKKILKLSKVSVDELKHDIACKKVLDFQISDTGWETLSKECVFVKNLEKNKRYDFLQKLSVKGKKEVDDVARTSLVSLDKEAILKALDRKPLKKEEYIYSSLVPSKLFEKGFDEKAFLEKLSSESENRRLNLYTQNNKEFYRVILIKEFKNKEFLSFHQALNGGYLQALLDKKLISLNNGKKIEDKETRKKLVTKLLLKKDRVQGEKILSLEKENKGYFGHQEKRLKDFRESKDFSSENPLLKQFAIYNGKEVVSRSNKNRDMANENLFAMDIDTISEIEFLRDGQPYYVQMKDKKIDSGKLKRVKAKVHQELSKEVRDDFEENILGKYFNENDKENNKAKKNTLQKWYVAKRFLGGEGK